MSLTLKYNTPVCNPFGNIYTGSRLLPIQGTIVPIPFDFARIKPMQIISRDADGDTATLCSSGNQLFFIAICEISTQFVRYLCFKTRSADFKAMCQTELSCLEFVKNGTGFHFFDMDKRTGLIPYCYKVSFDQIPQVYLPEPQLYLGKCDD